MACLLCDNGFDNSNTGYWKFITTEGVCDSCKEGQDKLRKLALDNNIEDWYKLLTTIKTKQNKTMEQELTFGQKAVGLAFNPSGDDKVTNAKQLFADVIDNMIGDPSKDVERRTYLYNIIRTAGISACISASMAVVKFITWRD